ncbi:MAG: acylphosphatase [Sphingomonadales bacterium]|nr:acylphosphatase [Sphingomonadales bacterium]
MSGEIAQRLTIAGRVQGVGYRLWAQGKARGLGVLGWVRNRQDGSVEILVQGAPDAVEDFILASERGPRGAKIENVIAVPQAVQELAGFEVLPDA